MTHRLAARLARIRAHIESEQRSRGESRLSATLGVVYWKLWRRRRAARQLRVAALRVRTTRARPSATAHALLGGELLAERRGAEAAVQLERALEIDPDLLELYERCAVAYHLTGRTDDVVRLQRRGIELRERLAREQQVDRLGFRIVHPAFAGAIGHMAETDVLVKQQLLLGRAMDELLYVAPGLQAANRTYLEYWLSFFPRVISDEETAAQLRPLSRLLTLPFLAWRGLGGEVQYFYTVAHEVQRRWEAKSRPPLLALSDEHRERGRESLRRLRVPEEAWFVGLHVREDPVLEYRNASLAAYEQAIAAVVERGGWVVRMGDPSMTRLPPAENVVDYAHSEAKSDWMDVFLWAEGRFMIGTQSGPAQVPQTFGNPVLLTNWAGHPYWYSGDIYLPRLYWSERERRFLTFAEASSSPVNFTILRDEVEKHGLRARDNTPDELAEGVHEMLDALEGRAGRAEDEALRRRFEQIETPWKHPVPRAGGARIGHGFLRRHQDLLGDAP